MSWGTPFASSFLKRIVNGLPASTSSVFLSYSMVLATTVRPPGGPSPPGAPLPEGAPDAPGPPAVAWPAGDLAVRKAVSRFCGEGRALSIDEVRALGERFAPFENLSAHYLLASLARDT